MAARSGGVTRVAGAVELEVGEAIGEAIEAEVRDFARGQWKRTGGWIFAQCI